MSEAIPLSDIPENIGRNDPCPCGSEKKYKKCCERAHRLQRESEKASNQPHRLIGPSTIAWRVLKVLQQVRANNAVGLFHEICHDQGPIRAAYPEKNDFMQAVDAGTAALPAGPDMDFLHVRLDKSFTYILLKEDDPKKDSVAFQIITLRRNELDGSGTARDVEHKGFRVWEVRNESLPRTDLGEEPPKLETFGIQWEAA